jgi:hypothetical protein
MDSKWTLKRILLSILAGYLCANVAFFVLNPFASSWHYHGHKPQPIPVTLPQDASLSLSQLIEILDEIDLAYRGRAATADEEPAHTIMRIVALVFFPADFALQMKDFIGYMGPATAEQQAFTISVKRRYNHLARLAVAKGMKRDGYFFMEDSILRKRNGSAFNGRKLATGAKSCGLEKSARSVEGKVATRIRFVNSSDEVIKVFWLDYAGKRKLYKTLGTGETYTQRTYLTNPWVVTNATDACVRLYFPGARITQAVVE